MPKPRVEDHIIDNPNVIKALGKAAIEPIDSVIIICGLDCGMRVSEIAHMRRSWWDGRIIDIPPRQECHCYECTKTTRAELKRGIWTPKTKRAIRKIPVRPKFRPILDAFFKRYKEFPIGRVMIWHRVKRLQKIASIRGNIFPHALRGTYITGLLDRNIPEAVIRDLVGHESIATTSKYSKFSKERLEQHLREKVW